MHGCLFVLVISLGCLFDYLCSRCDAWLFLIMKCMDACSFVVHDNINSRRSMSFNMIRLNPRIRDNIFIILEIKTWNWILEISHVFFHTLNRKIYRYTWCFIYSDIHNNFIYLIYTKIFHYPTRKYLFTA